jgi:hypothetical protein
MFDILFGAGPRELMKRGNCGGIAMNEISVENLETAAFR